MTTPGEITQGQPPAYGDKFDPSMNGPQPGQPAGYPTQPEQTGYPPQPGYYPPQQAAPVVTNIFRQPDGTSTGMPNDYMILSIIVTIFCCLPCGILAIVKASEVKSKWSAGDVLGARSSSAEAKKYAMIGLILGIVTEVVFVVVAIIYYARIYSSIGTTYYG